VFEAPSRVSTSEVAEVLQRTRDKMFAYLRRRGMLALGDEDDANEMAPLAASAVAGTTPPAGSEWRRGKLPLTHQAMKMGRPLCVALDTRRLHSARSYTRRRHGRRRARGTPQIHLETLGRAGASHARTRRARAHHAQNGVRGRHCRRGHGPAVVAHSACVRAAAEVFPLRGSRSASHRALLGSPRFGEQAPFAHRTQASPDAGRCLPIQPTTPTSHAVPAPIVPGRTSCAGPSAWTCC